MGEDALPARLGDGERLVPTEPADFLALPGRRGRIGVAAIEKVAQVEVGVAVRPGMDVDVDQLGTPSTCWTARPVSSVAPRTTASDGPRPGRCGRRARPTCRAPCADTARPREGRRSTPTQSRAPGWRARRTARHRGARARRGTRRCTPARGRRPGFARTCHIGDHRTCLRRGLNAEVVGPVRPGVHLVRQLARGQRCGHDPAITPWLRGSG